MQLYTFDEADDDWESPGRPPLPGPDDEPPPVIGAAVGPPSLAIGDNLAEFNRETGRGVPWAIRRSYNGGLASSLPAQPAGVVAFYSQKSDPTQTAAGDFDNTLKLFAKSCPAGTYLTWQHEPENPTKNISGAQFVAGFNKFAQIVKNENPSVLVGPVYMEYQWRVRGASWTYATGLNLAYVDFWGFDVYNIDFAGQGYHASDSVQTVSAGIYNHLQSIATKPTVIAELGSETQWVSNRPQWIATGKAWADAHNTTILHYQVGKWFLSDAELTALVALIS